MPQADSSDLTPETSPDDGDAPILLSITAAEPAADDAAESRAEADVPQAEPQVPEAEPCDEEPCDEATDSLVAPAANEASVITAEDEEASRTLLEELDVRQNDVLSQLDELNARIESLIQDWTAQNRSDEDSESIEAPQPAEADDQKAA